VRPKLVGYFLVLILMSGLLVFRNHNPSPLEVDIIRDRNSLYRETNDGLIENVYTLKILNKSQTKTNLILLVLSVLDGATFNW